MINTVALTSFIVLGTATAASQYAKTYVRESVTGYVNLGFVNKALDGVIGTNDDASIKATYVFSAFLVLAGASLAYLSSRK